jgi:hypothetical protein
MGHKSDKWQVCAAWRDISYECICILGCMYAMQKCHESGELEWQLVNFNEIRQNS